MKQKIIIAIMSLLIASGTVFAQRTKTVTVTASGVAVGSDVRIAKRDALHDAKKKALIEAGVDENVQSVTTRVIDGDAGGLLQSSVSEVSMLMVDGKVRLKGEPRYDVGVPNEDNLIRVECTIRAEVIKEEHPDETFRVKVEGLHSIYRDGEKVAMTFTPFADCWIRVFWFDRAVDAEVEGAMVFPATGIYRDLPLQADSTYSFPKLPKRFVVGNPQDLTAFKQSLEMMETNIVFVVALKKPVPYDRAMCNYEEFIDWLMEIPADQRFVFWSPVGIVENR